MTISIDNVRTFIEDYWRPRVQADGGEIRFVSYENDELTVLLQGGCATCSVGKTCLTDFLNERFQATFGRPVRITKRFEKPYFWDK